MRRTVLWGWAQGRAARQDPEGAASVAPARAGTTDGVARGGDQRWVMSGGATRSALSPTLCLDVDHSGTADGTNVMVYKCNGQPNQRWSVQWQSPRGVIASRAIARQITPGDEIANHCGAVVSKRALMSVVTGPSWKMYRAPCADCSPMADQLPSDSSPGDAPASMV